MKRYWKLIAGCGCLLVLLSMCFIGLAGSAVYYVATMSEEAATEMFGGPLRDRWRDRRNRDKDVPAPAVPTVDPGTGELIMPPPSAPPADTGRRRPFWENLANNKTDRKEIRKQKLASRGKLGQGILMAGGGILMMVIALVVLVSVLFPKK
jgi:hypothetical protein